MVDNKQPGEGAQAAREGGGTHIPVMLDEVLHAVQPAAGKLIVDGTFGAGGYSRAFLQQGADVLAIDRDDNVNVTGHEFAVQYGERFQYFNDEFADLARVVDDAGLDGVDGVVLDVGVSSMQIDEAHRGFSFQKDGPLDMRMGRSGFSAADLINRADGSDLTRIIGILGEERHAGRVSRAIVARRSEAPILRTLELANLIEKTLGRKFSDRIHPATRTFQALRIFVNRELEQLAQALFAAERVLRSGGRLVVVTFHSLEDRIVKQFFADRCAGVSGSRHLPQVEQVQPCFTQIKRSAIKARTDEAQVNARARSAKLRWGIRSDAPPRESDMSIFGRQVSLTLSGKSIEGMAI